MKPAPIFALAAMCTCLALVSLSSTLAAAPVRFASLKGKIRVEGTSNIDTWQVESKSMVGLLETGGDFPTRPGQKTSPGPVDVRAEVSVEVRSLKSVEKDGKPFSNKMDEIMYEAMRARENPKVTFRLSRLVLTQPAKVSSSPHEFEAHGRLTVAGASNETILTVKVQPLSGNQIRIWGTASLKMTDFRIEPPSPTIALGLIRTGDEVKVSFDWTLARQ